jgi:hypothetical protein
MMNVEFDVEAAAACDVVEFDPFPPVLDDETSVTVNLTFKKKLKKTLNTCFIVKQTLVKSSAT